MYILETISAIDLITVCLITIACVITMICIIVISSKTPKKKKKEVDVSLVSAPKIEKIEAIKVEESIPQESIKPKADIQSVLDKMETELESGSKEVHHTFEQEQEQKAIISYKELLKVAGKLKEEIKENEDEMEHILIEPPHLEEVKNIKEEVEEKKFKGSEFISPVYGKQELSPDESYIGRHEEKKQNDDFLTQLKDLRKNLE